MKLSLSQLNKIIEEQLPKPGSINFQNCQQIVEVKLYRTVGWLELADESDPSGMKSGGHEVIREHVGSLKFEKKGSDWEIEFFSREDMVEAVERTRDIITDTLNKKHAKEMEELLPANKKGKKETKGPD